MMRDRAAILGLAVAAVLGAGCARMGLDAWPEVPPEKQGDTNIGLDVFPEPMHPGESGDLGLDPFPAAMHPGASGGLGIDPFPKAMHPEGQGRLGLDPFPKPMHPGQKGGTGLTPFPDIAGRKPAAGTGPVHPGSSEPATGIARSEEYPDAPPVDVKPIPKSPAPKEKPMPDDGKPK